MLRTNFEHGFAPSAWEAAKLEARRILIDHARRERTIAYSDLVARIPQIDLSAYDERLFNFLGQIGEAESLAGRGILTATVVHKTGDMSPGGGFYELAKALGHRVTDRDQFWIEELGRVSAYWKQTVVRDARRVGDLDHLPISIPAFRGSHPFSRSTNPKFYRRAELADTAEGDTDRTRFFEKVLLGIFWTINRSVPYAFITKNNEVRSLDAGCVKFLLNRQTPRIKLVCDAEEVIVAVEPTEALVESYRNLRGKLTDRVRPDEALMPLDFDLDSPIDERRRVQAEKVIREGAATFRVDVLSAWNNKCAVTKTAIDAVLDAAHIHRYLGPKTNDVRNGLALRADIHRLFDQNLLTVVMSDIGAQVRVSTTLTGSRYAKLNGAAVTLPPTVSLRPDTRVLEHHNRAFLDAERGRR